MKQIVLSSLIIASTSALAASPGYELRRIHVARNGTSERVESRCHITAGQVVHSSKVAGIVASQTGSLSVDAAAVQTLTENAVGIARPDFDSAESFTNWWVRSAANEPFKLVRSNLRKSNVDHVYADESAAGKALATFMGTNCYRVFGE